jgi:hypothetical protein
MCLPVQNGFKQKRLGSTSYHRLLALQVKRHKVLEALNSVLVQSTSRRRNGGQVYSPSDVEERDWTPRYLKNGFQERTPKLWAIRRILDCNETCEELDQTVTDSTIFGSWVFEDFSVVERMQHWATQKRLKEVVLEDEPLFRERFQKVVGTPNDNRLKLNLLIFKKTENWCMRFQKKAKSSNLILMLEEQPVQD